MALDKHAGLPICELEASLPEAAKTDIWRLDIMCSNTRIPNPLFCYGNFPINTLVYKGSAKSLPTPYRFFILPDLVDICS
jgi:hypothetical protein